MAAATLAPVEMPTSNPSSLARRRAMANESSLVTWMHSHDLRIALAVLEMKILGDEPGARALNLVRAGLERLSGQALRNDRRILRLNGDGLKGRLARLDGLHATR